jgi:hypothetical protein
LRAILERKHRAIRVFGYTDIHFPNEDKEALQVAMAGQRFFKPDITIVGNDLIDCTPYTGWADSSLTEALAKDWRNTELRPANKFLNAVQKHTKKTIFLPGNHDKWVERWAARAGKIGLAIHDIISIKTNLCKGRKNFEYKDSVNLHRYLSVVHGWSYCKHAAYKHVELSKTKSIIFHHTHRRQMITTRDPWYGRPIEAISAGCLCEQVPMYRHDGAPTEWTHGFWVAFIGKRSFTIYPILIHEARAIMPDGKEIKLV